MADSAQVALEPKCWQTGVGTKRGAEAQADAGLLYAILLSSRDLTNVEQNSLFAFE